MAKAKKPELDLGGGEPAEHAHVSKVKLVRVYKDGGKLDINPDPAIVADHVKNGWTLVNPSLETVDEE